GNEAHTFSRTNEFPNRPRVISKKCEIFIFLSPRRPWPPWRVDRNSKMWIMMGVNASRALQKDKGTVTKQTARATRRLEMDMSLPDRELELGPRRRVKPGKS